MSSSWLLATADSLKKTPSAAELAAAQLAAEQRQRRDVVAEWRVSTKERLHVIEFEHGTTSGKRVLWIDGKVYMRPQHQCEPNIPHAHAFFVAAGDFPARMDVQAGRR